MGTNLNSAITLPGTTSCGDSVKKGCAVNRTLVPLFILHPRSSLSRQYGLWARESRSLLSCKPKRDPCNNTHLAYIAVFTSSRQAFVRDSDCRDLYLLCFSEFNYMKRPVVGDHDCLLLSVLCVSSSTFPGSLQAQGNHQETLFPSL